MKKFANIGFVRVSTLSLYISFIFMAYIYPLLNASYAWLLVSIVGLGLCTFCLLKMGKVHVSKDIAIWFCTLFPLLFNSYSLHVHEYSYTVIWILLLLMFLLSQYYTSWCKNCIILLIVLCLIYAISTIFINVGITAGFEQIALLFRPGIYQGTFRTAGLTAHYSHNGMYIAVGCILSGSLYLGNMNKRVYKFLLFVCFVIALLLTQKRGPLIALCISIITTYFLQVKENMSQKVKRIFIFSLILLVMLYISYEAFPALFSVLDRFSSDDTLSNRTYLWEFALDMFRENPIIGQGWGTYSHRLNVTVNTLVVSNQYAHNIYIQLLAETGVIGFLCFTLPMIITLYKSLKLLKDTYNDSNSGVVMFASSSMQLFFLIYGLSGNPLYDKQMYIPYMLAVASYISYHKYYKYHHS